MGKSQTKKKTRQTRHNPMRVPDAHLGSGKSSQVDQGKEKQMLPILKKLSAPEYADRTWACAAISNLVQGDAATRRMFQGNNVVGALIERLSDGVDEVVVEASGALRNLAIDGGHELCAEMYNKGIMSHLTVLIKKCTNTITTISTSTPATNLDEAEYQGRKHLLGLTENVLSLVWSLAEANHKTLAAVNAAGVEELLFLGLQGRQVLGMGVALAAAQAMYSLSQDNPDFQRIVLRNPTAIQTLVEIVSADHQVVEGKGKGKGKASGKNEVIDDGRALLLRVLVAGSLRNIVGASSDSKLQADLKTLTNETILPLVNGLLDVDLPALVQQVMQHLTAMGSADQQVKTMNGASTDHRSPAEIALENIERMLMTVIVGLEILTGICAGVEDAEELEAADAAEVEIAEEVEAEDDAMDGEDNEMESDDELFDESRDPPANGSTQPNEISTPVTLPHLLSTLSLPSRLSSLSTLTALSLPPASAQPSPHPPTTSALSVLHLRALEAMNNLLLTVYAASSASPDPSISQLANVIPVREIWAAVFRNVDLVRAEREALRQKGQEMRMEILQGCVGCLWGLAKISPDSVGVTPQQESTLVEAVSVLSSDLAKTRTIEILSALAARSTVSIEETREISKWLIGQLSTPLEPEILVAVLNAIIDIFSDETRSYDAQVFVAGGYLQVLSDAVSGVRAKVKQVDRRKELRLRGRAEEASDNLSAFVQYRKSLGR